MIKITVDGCKNEHHNCEYGGLSEECPICRIERLERIIDKLLYAFNADSPCEPLTVEDITGESVYVDPSETEEKR